MKTENQKLLKAMSNNNLLKLGDILVGTIKSKKNVLIITFIFIATSLTGCWGQIGLGEMNLVTILGVDSAPNGETKVTVLVNAPAGTAAGMAQKTNVWIGTATGTSFADALTNLNSTANKRLVWYHTRAIIVGSASAKESLAELLDFIVRNRQIRLSTHILITDGEANAMLSTPADVQQGLAQEIEGMIQNAPESSKAYIPHIKDLLMAASSKSAETLIGKIGYKMETQSTYSTNRQEARNEYWIDRPFGTGYVEGSSVIKEDKLVGFLDEKQTRGCLWALNKVEEANVSAKSDNDDIALEYRTSKASIKPKISGDKISINIKLVVRGMLSETTANKDYLKLPDLKEAQKLFEEEIKGEISSAISKLQKEYNSDALGFDKTIRRKYPKQWKEIEPNWHSIFPEVEVNYDIKVILRRLGKTNNTILKKD